MELSNRTLVVAILVCVLVASGLIFLYLQPTPIFGNRIFIGRITVFLLVLVGTGCFKLLRQR